MLVINVHEIKGSPNFSQMNTHNTMQVGYKWDKGTAGPLATAVSILWLDNLHFWGFWFHTKSHGSESHMRA